VTQPQPIDFRAAVKSELARQNMTITAAARAAGMNHSALSAWLNKRAPNMRSDLLSRVLAAVGLTLTSSGSAPTPRPKKPATVKP